MTRRERLFESIEWAAFLLVLAGIVIAMSAVDPCAQHVC